MTKIVFLVLPALALAACGPVAEINRTTTQTVTQEIKKVPQQQKPAAAPKQDQAIGTTQSQQPADQIISCRDIKQPLDANSWVTSARNMSCREAIEDINTPTGGGDPTQGFRSAGGFQCSMTSGESMGGSFRCVQGNRAYRYEWGD